MQGWFIQRIERYLNANGRRLIGWDEILDGGLAPNATVMSWRGTVGGIEAARQGHDVVMTPYSHLYLDFYQTGSSPELCVKVRGSSSMLLLGCLGDLLRFEKREIQVATFAPERSSP